MTTTETDRVMVDTANFARAFEASRILHPLAELMLQPRSLVPGRVMPIETPAGLCAIGVFSRDDAERGGRLVEVCSLARVEYMRGFSVEVHRGLVVDGALASGGDFTCEAEDCTEYEFGRWGVQRRSPVTAELDTEENTEDGFGHPVEQYLYGLKHDPEARDLAVDICEPGALEDARIVMGGIHVVGGIVRPAMERLGAMGRFE